MTPDKDLPKFFPVLALNSSPTTNLVVDVSCSKGQCVGSASALFLFYFSIFENEFTPNGLDQKKAKTSEVNLGRPLPQ